MVHAQEGAGLPSFIVIGTMKGGTSSLHRYLGQHPEICMSREKEPNFFVKATSTCKGLDWYCSLFADHSKVCGEVSPAYSKRHQHRDVPEQLYRIVPHVKLIYILRDPIDRMISHYLHNQIHGRTRRALAETLAANSYRNNYVLTSMYRFQLFPFLRRFPLERILITTAENLKEKRAETLRSMFQFIGVDPDFEHSEFRRMYHQTPVLARPVLRQEDRDRLAEHLAPDVDGLRVLTGLRFERWCL
jgi:Sulfotransferase domain